MIVRVHALYDKVSGEFLSPTFESVSGVAVRSFRHAVMSGTSVISSHADDFELYHIADFDTKSADFTPVHPIELVVRGSSLAGDIVRRSSDD